MTATNKKEDRICFVHELDKADSFWLLAEGCKNGLDAVGSDTLLATSEAIGVGTDAATGLSEGTATELSVGLDATVLAEELDSDCVALEGVGAGLEVVGSATSPNAEQLWHLFVMQDMQSASGFGVLQAVLHFAKPQETCLALQVEQSSVYPTTLIKQRALQSGEPAQLEPHFCICARFTPQMSLAAMVAAP